MNSSTLNVVFENVINIFQVIPCKSLQMQHDDCFVSTIYLNLQMTICPLNQSHGEQLPPN